MKSKSDKIKLVIIILELIILIGLSSYRIYEFVDKSKEEIKGNENNNSKEDEKDNISTEEQTRGKIKILVYQINIRREANETSEDIGEVLVDEIYDVLEIIDSDNYTWYKINKNGVIGYVANQKGENWIDYVDSNVEILDINSDLVKSLNIVFNVPDTYFGRQYLYYLGDIFEVEKASMDALKLISTRNVSHDCFYSASERGFLLKASCLENSFKELFGPDVDFIHGTYNIFPEICNTYTMHPDWKVEDILNLNNSNFKAEYNVEYNDYLGLFSFGCGGPSIIIDFSKVENYKFEKDNDNIYVYSYAYNYGLDKDYFDYTNYFDKINNNLINLRNFENNYHCYISDWKGNTIYNHENGICNENTIENLKVQNKLPIYKSTYKKQSDGNYYFTKGEWIN